VIFDETNVLPDRALLGYDGDSIDVSAFLKAHGSPIANRILPSGFSFGSKLKERCREFGISVRWGIVRLQCESGLVSGQFPTRNGYTREQEIAQRESKAYGVGCLDDGRVIEKWLGLEMQIHGFAYFCAKISQKVAPMVGKPYALDAANKEDRKVIVCKNVATLMLYEYTPHVDAARETWDVFRRYFPESLTA